MCRLRRQRSFYRVPCPEKHPLARRELHLIHAADSPHAGRDGRLPLGRIGVRGGRGGRGLGEENGRGEVIPCVLSIPVLERLSLSQDSCCGHTTNLKAVLLLGACLSSPPSPSQSSNWCLALRRSRQALWGQQRPLPLGLASAAAASALHQGRRRLRGSARAAAQRSSRLGRESPPRPSTSCIPFLSL